VGGNTHDDIMKEVRAMEKLCTAGHENMIQIFEHGVLRQNLPYYFIDMELCDINLDEYIKGRITGIHGLLDWKDAIRDQQAHFLIFGITQQILLGLIFMHSKDEVHRDLTPQNGLTPDFRFGY
jgi:serine/threonine protein kinase